MLNELLYKELSNQVETNTSDIEDINNDIANNIKLIKVKKYFSISPGWHKESVGKVEIPDGYTYLGIIPEKVENNNIFPIYSYHNGTLYSEIYIAGSSNITSNYYCYIVLIHTEYLSKIFLKQLNY